MFFISLFHLSQRAGRSFCFNWTRFHVITWHPSLLSSFDLICLSLSSSHSAASYNVERLNCYRSQLFIGALENNATSNTIAMTSAFTVWPAVTLLPVDQVIDLITLAVDNDDRRMCSRLNSSVNEEGRIEKLFPSQQFNCLVDISFALLSMAQEWTFTHCVVDIFNRHCDSSYLPALFEIRVHFLLISYQGPLIQSNLVTDEQSSEFCSLTDVRMSHLDSSIICELYAMTLVFTCYVCIALRNTGNTDDTLFTLCWFMIHNDCESLSHETINKYATCVYVECNLHAFKHWCLLKETTRLIYLLMQCIALFSKETHTACRFCNIFARFLGKQEQQEDRSEAESLRAEEKYSREIKWVKK